MSSEGNACGCEALDTNAEIFKGFPSDIRVMQALRVIPRMFTEKRKFSEIVRIAALLPSPENMVLVIKQNQRGLDRLDFGEITKIQEEHTKKFAELLLAIRGSCAQEIRKGVWLFDPDVQEFLHKFAEESEEKEAYWKDLMLQDFLNGNVLSVLNNWFSHSKGIKNCVKLFDLPEEKIRTRVENLVLEWGDKASIGDWNSSTKSIKMLIKEFGVSEEKIRQKLGEAINREMREQPLDCIAVAKEMGVSIEPWHLFLYEGANGLILKANDEECSSNRRKKIQLACDIYEALKRDLGDLKGDALLELWKNKDVENASRDFLRRASKILQFKYKAVGFNDTVWVWWHRIF
ncbi:MAG: hypothetical protein Q8N37_00110 [bacterium]|nr:hypothetical protein [bacterium]